MVTMTGMEFLEKFAGPIATAMASVAAVMVTLILGLMQYRIARSQANTAEAQRQIARAQLEIAYDKLKHDVFDKRYEVFLAAQKLIENGFEPKPPKPMDPEIVGLRNTVSQSLFLFPPDTNDFCNRIQRASYDAAYKLYWTDTEENRDEQSKAQITLSILRSEMHERFERDLSFEQLTKKIGVDERYSHYKWDDSIYRWPDKD